MIRRRRRARPRRNPTLAERHDPREPAPLPPGAALLRVTRPGFSADPGARWLRLTPGPGRGEAPAYESEFRTFDVDEPGSYLVFFAVEPPGAPWAPRAEGFYEGATGELSWRDDARTTALREAHGGALDALQALYFDPRFRRPGEYVVPALPRGNPWRRTPRGVRRLARGGRPRRNPHPLPPGAPALALRDAPPMVGQLSAWRNPAFDQKIIDLGVEELGQFRMGTSLLGRLGPNARYLPVRFLAWEPGPSALTEIARGTLDRTTGAIAWGSTGTTRAALARWGPIVEQMAAWMQDPAFPPPPNAPGGRYDATVEV